MIAFKPFDESGAFRPFSGEVRSAAIRGGAATLLSSGSGTVIQIAATVILARLLTPEDFGLVAMVTTFSLLLSNFGLNGFTEAIIQREKINRDLASNLFWISVGAGLLLTCGLAAAGSLLAWFYDEPRVENVAVGISFTILLTSTSVVHMALLQRAMRFPVVSAIGIFSRFLSVLLSILFSWAGWGYWALVLGAITVPLVGTIGSWAVCQWIPGRPKRVAGTGTMLRFALNVYAWFTVNYSSRNLDNVLIGWRFSPQALGFYKKAYDLFALSMAQLIAPLTKVAVAA